VYNQSIELEAPKAFQHHKDTFISLMNQKRLIFRLLEVSSETNTYNQNSFTALIKELNTLASSERISLIDAFKAADIEYQLLSDGSIKYWYKTNNPSLEKERKEHILKGK
jgi:uncharacterized protein YccT (UPF0319 family)